MLMRMYSGVMDACLWGYQRSRAAEFVSGIEVVSVFLYHAFLYSVFTTCPLVTCVS